MHVHRVVLATQSDALSELLPTTPDNGIMNWSAHCNDINDAKVSSLILHDTAIRNDLFYEEAKKKKREFGNVFGL